MTDNKSNDESLMGNWKSSQASDVTTNSTFQSSLVRIFIFCLIFINY